MQVFLLPTEQLATVYRHLLCLAALPASYTAHKLMVDQGLELGHILPSHLDPSWAAATLSLSINYRFISAVVLNYVLQTSLAGGLQRLAVVRGGGLVTWVAEYLPLVAVLPCLLALVPLPASLLLLAALLANLPAALLLGVSLGQQLPQVAAALRHMYATKRDFINNFGLNTFIENEWVRLRVPSVLRCFWLSRMSAMFLLHQTPLPDTALSPATALAAVKGVLVTGSETIVNEEGDIDEEFLAAEWTQSEVMREVSGSGVEPSCRVDHQCMRYIGGYLTYKVIIIRYTLTLTIVCIYLPVLT